MRGLSMGKVEVAVAAALRDAASHSKRGVQRTGATWFALGWLFGGWGTAWAHQAPAESSQSATLDEIVVTGSRIRRSTDFDSSNPTTVVDSSYLQNLGIVNVGAAITQLPSNISNNTPT